MAKRIGEEMLKSTETIAAKRRIAMLAGLMFACACEVLWAQHVWDYLPPRGYVAYRAEQMPVIDGKPDSVWRNAPWSKVFNDIEGEKKPAPRFQTRMKMLWDDEYLYVFADMEEPHVWGYQTKRDATIYHENDFEMFIKPSALTPQYGEFEMNACGTPWDLFFMRPYRSGADYMVSWDMREMKIGVHVDVILGADLQKKYKHHGGPLVQDKLLAEYDFGYHPIARKEYKEKFGVDPLEMDDTAENPAWQQFRMNAITTLVEECVDICHDAGTAASAAVFPFPQLGREYVRQDWGHWNLDVFFPMAYKKDHQGNMYWVGFATREGVRELSPEQLLFTGVSVGDYGDNMADFAEAIVQAHDNGATGISFFSANSLTDKHLAIIKEFDHRYNH